MALVNSVTSAHSKAYSRVSLRIAKIYTKEFKLACDAGLNPCELSAIKMPIDFLSQSKRQIHRLTVGSLEWGHEPIQQFSCLAPMVHPFDLGVAIVGDGMYDRLV
jgi:hypothetical protein